MPAKKEIDLKRFKELLDKGVSTKELCKIFDIAESSVARAKLKCGYLTKKFKILTEKIPKEILVDLFINKKMSICEIAKQFNETRNRIIELMDLYGMSQKERKLNISYEELYKDYKENKMTYEQISKKYNISTHEVADNIHKYKLTPNVFNGKISKEELYDLYIVKNIRANDVAKHFGCSLSTLNEYIKKYKLNKDPEQYHKLAKETCLEKYGVENGGWTEEAQKKIKETNNKKYGVNFYIQTQDFKYKTKKTCLEKYGTERLGSQIPEIFEKAKKTNLKKYGTEHYIATKECREKSKNTLLKRYGVLYPTQCEKFKLKGYETKKLNGTFGKSKEEDKMFELLQEKFGEVKRQYNSEKYPFICDFYIVSLDLYIEYQGFWNHGKIGTKYLGPYDQSNPEHQCLVAKWQQQLNDGHEAYRKAIRVWTVSDPLKRQTAKDNGLNWLEFWTFDEFMEWYEKQ